jgi:hypothetical protein
MADNFLDFPLETVLLFVAAVDFPLLTDSRN